MFAYTYESEDKLGEFIARIHPRDLEDEHFSLDELESMNRKLKEAEKEVTNQNILTILREVEYRDSFIAEVQKLSRKNRRKNEHNSFHEIPADSPLREEELPGSEEALPSYDDSRTAGSSTYEYSLALNADSPDEVKSSELNTGSAEGKEAVVSEDEIEIPEVEVVDWDEMMQDF